MRLSVIAGKGLVGLLLLLGVWGATVMAPCKTNTEHHFHFSPFCIQVKILFRFLSVRKTDSNRSFKKVK